MALSPYIDTHPLARERAQLLESALPNIVFDGWSSATLAQAARDTGLSDDAVAAAFPNGGIDALTLFLHHADAATESAIAALPLTTLKIRQKIEEAVMARLDWALPHREAVRSGLVLLSSPFHASVGLKSLYDTTDTIWHAIGDRSTDMNFYSKRALLAGVYSSTVLVWLDDHSENMSTTRQFLQHRIADVMKIETGKQWLKTQWARFTPASLRATTSSTRRSS